MYIYIYIHTYTYFRPALCSVPGDTYLFVDLLIDIITYIYIYMYIHIHT